MDLMQIAFFLLATVAVGGLLMVTLILAKKPIPNFLGPIHGLGGMVGIGVLLAANLQTIWLPDQAWWALAAFTAGLFGGALFFGLLYRTTPPLVLVAGHGALALIGLFLLYGVAFRNIAI